MSRFGLLLAIVLSLSFSVVLPRQLPKSLKSYLDRNYRGWNLAGECDEKESDNKRVLAGDFDGNGRLDYAVKFIRGDRGFFMAFLSRGNRWKPFYLHIWDDTDQAKYSDLMMFGPGDSWEMVGTPKFKFDTPADFRCESDVGGPDTYRGGKFVAY
ncbi:MAG: hypothetical protein AB7G18_07185 [Pyrinomonadaceae bacterium]